MLEQQNIEKHIFSDYIYILFKWKKFLIINLIIVSIISTTIAFLLPKVYKATATIMIPPSDQSALGGLSSLIGGSGKSSLASLGARAFGVSNTSEDDILGIINSRTALTDVINKFHLMSYYEINDNNMDKAIKAFKGDISFNPNEFGMIDFSVINENPESSADITNYLVSLVDSLNIKYNIEKAKNNRIFVEQRYDKNVLDMKKAEDSLYKFQKRFGIVAIPEQLEVSVKAAAEIESELNKKEIEAFFTKQQYGDNSPQYHGILAEVNLLKDKVQELKNSPKLSSTSNVLFPFKELPDIAMQYLRDYQEVKIQQEIMEIVMPMFEQAKIEEQKSIPTIMVVDKAVPPELKYGPKRSVIILGAIFLFLFLFIPLVFWSEKAVSREQFRNPLQIKEANFLKKIIKIYRMKL
jgi:capsule polysaccharide export protein KpsE/RkpR